MGFVVISRELDCYSIIKPGTLLETFRIEKVGKRAMKSPQNE